MSNIVFWYGFVSGLVFAVTIEYLVIWYAVKYLSKGKVK